MTSDSILKPEENSPRKQRNLEKYDSDNEMYALMA